MAQRGGPDIAEDECQAERRRELLSTYKTINGELADLTWTLAELEQQIATMAAEVSPPPEISMRLQDLRRWQGLLEERILGYMYRADELMAELARLRQ
jgi:hypothetical protein